MRAAKRTWYKDTKNYIFCEYSDLEEAVLRRHSSTNSKRNEINNRITT